MERVLETGRYSTCVPGCRDSGLLGLSVAHPSLSLLGCPWPLTETCAEYRQPHAQWAVVTMSDAESVPVHSVPHWISKPYFLSLPEELVLNVNFATDNRLVCKNSLSFLCIKVALPAGP